MGFYINNNKKALIKLAPRCEKNSLTTTLSKTVLWNSKKLYLYKTAQTILQKLSLVAEEIGRGNEISLNNKNMLEKLHLGVT